MNSVICSTTKATNTLLAAWTAKLVAPYNAYQALPGVHANGRWTLGANLADLAGWEASYQAYQMSLQGPATPVIAGFTGAQRVFLGNAQILRTK